jgi:hypothetical protein
VLLDGQSQYGRQSHIVHAGTYEDDLTVLGVAKGTSVYAQSDGRHNHKSQKRVCEKTGGIPGCVEAHIGSSWANSRMHARHPDVITAAGQAAAISTPAGAGMTGVLVR